MYLSITVDVDDPFFGGAGGMRVLWNFFSVSVFCKVFIPQSVFSKFQGCRNEPIKHGHEFGGQTHRGPFSQRNTPVENRTSAMSVSTPRNFHFQTFYNLLAEQGFRTPRKKSVLCVGWCGDVSHHIQPLLTKNTWNLRYTGVQKSSFFFFEMLKWVV